MSTCAKLNRPADEINKKIQQMGPIIKIKDEFCRWIKHLNKSKFYREIKVDLIYLGTKVKYIPESI